jgi:hypothetical protein
MNETWLLFEDGGHDAVRCTLYPLPKDYPRPVDAYIVFEHSGDFTIAAQKAVHAVFHLVQKRNIPVQPVNAGFDLAGKSCPDAGLAGQSGGLCFALAFAKKLLKLNLPDIAATGILSSDGRISAIKGIEAKLRTALTLLKENDRIFFPADNQDQIPDDLITQIKDKTILLHPVTTLDQVMDILTDSIVPDPGSAPPGPEKTAPGPLIDTATPNRRRLVLLVLLLTAACLFAGFQIWGNKTDPPATLEKPGLESHDIPIPREENTLTFKTEPLDSAQNHTPENPGEAETLDATEMINTEDTPDSETPATDNKGFD